MILWQSIYIFIIAQIVGHVGEDQSKYLSLSVFFCPTTKTAVNYMRPNVAFLVRVLDIDGYEKAIINHTSFMDLLGSR